MSLFLKCRNLLQGKSNFIIQSCKASEGFIILLPEIPEEIPDNPLLKTADLPEIEGLTKEKIVSAIGRNILDFESAVWKAEEQLQGPKSVCDLFDEILGPLEKHCIPLDDTWCLARSLHFTKKSLMPTEAYIGIHHRARRARSTKYTSPHIYKACKESLAAHGNSYSQEQKRIVNKFLLEGYLNGIDLHSSKRLQFLELSRDINADREAIRMKVDVNSREFTHQIKDPNIMRDIPESVLKMMAADPTQPTRGPWVVTLQAHIHDSFLQYCGERELRWNTWIAGVNRCFQKDYPERRTSVHIETLRDNRIRLARLLGFKNFADMSMQTKMVESVEELQEVLETLRLEAKPKQDEEIKRLQDFAEERGFANTLQMWDVPYWSRKERKTVYSYDEEKLCEYFPFPNVLSGLFSLCEHLFNIKITQQSGVDVWHSDVHFYMISDADSGEHLGGFYLDPYDREEDKPYGHTGMGLMMSLRHKSSQRNQLPLATLAFNFQQPLYGKPSLLTFENINLLFEKFGLALQHLLTTATSSEVSGLSNVEWDAVGISGKFLTHWLYDKNTLKSICKHYDSEETLPEDVINKLCYVRQHFAGFNLCEELYRSSLDLELHSCSDYWVDVMERLWKKHYSFALDKLDTHPLHFTEIFCDQWGAAYYCDLWSHLVAADAFSAFWDVGLDNREQTSVLGKRFRSSFLSLGGSLHSREVFRMFRGRDPSPKALLNILGLRQKKKNLPVE